MNYNKPELIEQLSAEYVLGTLQGKARDRFERLMQNSNRIRMAVWNWENQIVPMATIGPKVRAPSYLWYSIRARILKTSVIKPKTKAARNNNIAANKSSTTQSMAASLWRWWAYSATTACLVLGLFLVSQLRDEAIIDPSLSINIDSIALFSNQDNQPQWLVSFDLESGQLKAKALNDVAIETGRAFELWVLPETGNPQSLGLLPVTNSVDTELNTTLPAALIAIIQSANGLAISLEPETGSPTGLPTGPVVYQSSIVDL